MNGQIGIIYSTVDGQTLKICTVLANHLKEKQQNVHLFSIEAFNGEITGFDVLFLERVCVMENTTTWYNSSSQIIERNWTG